MRKESRAMDSGWALEVMHKATYMTVSFIDEDGKPYGLPLSLASDDDVNWYYKRSGNSTDGWRTTGCQAYANTRFLYYINEIRSSVLIVHGEKAHSRYFGESAFRYMMDGKAEGYDFVRKPNPVPENKKLLIVPGASHCDLYDGGGKGMIPWDNIEDFLKKNLK